MAWERFKRGRQASSRDITIREFETSPQVARERSLRLFRSNDGLCSEQHHPCGCVTFFHLIDWRSVIVIGCDEHRRYVGRYWVDATGIPVPLAEQVTNG